jgi:hypothetical protein
MNMGKTKRMIKNEQRRRQRTLREQSIPTVEVVDDAMAEAQDSIRKYTVSFDSGTAGLKVKKEKSLVS